MKKTLSVMIPCYNEEENVRPIYATVRNVILTECQAYDYEILFIDNKSSDRTREIIREICTEDKNVKAIFNVTNFGQFNSPYYAMLQTTGDCTLSLSADFQDPPELIPQFVKEWESGYKVVIGVKTRSKENPVVYMLRGLYYKTIKKMSHVDQIEHFAGFALYDRSFIETLKKLHDPQPYIKGLVSELGPERKEIEYEQQKRKAGKSKNNFFTLYDAAMVGFTSYTKVGLRLATYFGFLVAFVSFIAGIIYIILKFMWWREFTAGSAAVTVGQFFLGGVQLVFLGFLGEYVMAINARVMNRPLVVEEERINFEEKNVEKQELSNTTSTGIKNETSDAELYIAKVYQARRIILAGGKATEIMTATGLSEEESQRIYDEELSMQ